MDGKSECEPDETNVGLIANEIKADAQKMFDIGRKIEHAKVLQEILDGITPIDFRELTTVAPDKPVSQKTQIVITVEHVLRIAQDLNCGLCRNGDFIYTYNGEWWQRVDKDQIERFLGEAAQRLGVDSITARYHKVKTELSKQFYADAHLPKPVTSSDSVKINLTNGTFEINQEGVTLRSPDREDFLTYQLPFEYNAAAKYPLWQKFLDEVLPDGDRSRQMILAEFIGYVFARRQKVEKCLILYGSGANGKSVVFDVISALLGRENVSNVSLESLSKDQYYRATIADKLLNYSSEISSRLQSEKFKQLTSGEPIEARLPYGQPMTLTEYARLAFNSNELPRDVEHTEAFFRRFLIIPFDITIDENRRNPNLARSIIANELSGVFNWVLEGLDRLLAHEGFSRSAAVEEILKTFRRESDSVAMFLSENGYKDSSTERIILKALYQEYREYCHSDGYRAVSNRSFKARLEHSGITVERGSGNKYFVWVGQSA